MRILARAFFIGAFVSLSFHAPPADAAEPQPGLWKISGVSERNGATVGQRTQERCFTPEEARDLMEVRVDLDLEPEKACKVVDAQRAGNSRTYRIQCSGGIPTETNALYVFDSPDHYSAVITTTVTIVRTTLSSTLRIEAQRIGECPR